jgi:hypothetical protein
MNENKDKNKARQQGMKDEFVIMTWQQYIAKGIDSHAFRLVCRTLQIFLIQIKASIMRLANVQTTVNPNLQFLKIHFYLPCSLINNLGKGGV